MIDEQSRDGVRIVKLAHGKVNAMDIELLDAITHTFSALEKEGEGPVVLTGNGSAFSAGVDLRRVVREGRPYLGRFLPALSQAFRAVFECPRPVIGAINGHAIAGGCVLACACDHRIMASSNARIGVPELYVGVPFPAVALEIVRYAVAPAHLQEIVYSGRTFSTEDALARGLVDEAVEAEGVLERALEQSQRYATVRSATYALTKRQLQAEAVARYRRGEMNDNAEVDALWLSNETIPAIEDYLERTLGKKR
ncbi:MAG: enoyl-CoA hydratase/isomerase family protein [Gammaproteobacteria bacterium]